MNPYGIGYEENITSIYGEMAAEAIENNDYEEADRLAQELEEKLKRGDER